jgi:transposase
VKRERTSVGLDVHARSVVACGIDDRTGELFRARLCPQPEAVLGWLREPPGPVAVVYEAGSTGYGLARFLSGHNITCVVAAPSKLQRPSGDRVKTDAKDALQLARLLRLGEVTPVAVPTVAQETARDLVRAREDVRGDLMRARHRTSKLLLRQGIVWSGGTAWTGAHHDWLRRQSFDQPALAAAYDSALETVLLSADRRDRLDKTIVEMAGDPAWSPVVTRLQCLRGVSTLTAFGSPAGRCATIWIGRPEARRTGRSACPRRCGTRTSGAAAADRSGRSSPTGAAIPPRFGSGREEGRYVSIGVPSRAAG